MGRSLDSTERPFFKFLMSKPLTRKEKSIASKYRRMLNAQRRAASQYELSDRLGFELGQLAGGHGQLVRISQNLALQVTEPMKTAIENPKREPTQMPKAWAHAAVRFFDFKEITLPAEPTP